MKIDPNLIISVGLLVIVFYFVKDVLAEDDDDGDDDGDYAERDDDRDYAESNVVSAALKPVAYNPVGVLGSSYGVYESLRPLPSLTEIESYSNQEKSASILQGVIRTALGPLGSILAIRKL